MKRKKIKEKKKLLSIIKWTMPFVTAIFLVILLTSFWGFIQQYSRTILFITAILILIYIALGIWNWNTFLQIIRGKL